MKKDKQMDQQLDLVKAQTKVLEWEELNLEPLMEIGLVHLWVRRLGFVKEM